MNCISCNEELEPVVPQTPSHPDCKANHYEVGGNQWLGALHLNIQGGYNEYWDGDPQMIFFCSDCADELCERYPNIAKCLGFEAPSPMLRLV